MDKHAPRNEDMRDQGLRSLQWLLEIQTDQPGGHLSLIGNNGWLRQRGERARFDQQPLEALALLDSCYEAFHATQHEQSLVHADRSLDWFLGRNDTHEVVTDLRTGACQGWVAGIWREQQPGSRVDHRLVDGFPSCSHPWCSSKHDQQ